MYLSKVQFKLLCLLFLVEFLLIILVAVFSVAHYLKEIEVQNQTTEIIEQVLNDHTPPNLYEKASLITGCPVYILIGLAKTESTFNPLAIGDNGVSKGMFQINETFREERVRKYGEYDPFDPEQSAIIAGYIYMENLKRLNYDEHKAIASYRQGVHGVRKNGIKVSQWYIEKVLEVKTLELTLIQ